LTIGVQYRVDELADRKEGKSAHKKARPFRHLIPLSEIIAKAIDSKETSKKTWAIYNSLIRKFGNEFNVLLHAKKEELLEVIDERIADFIIKNRRGDVEVIPGYDGEYGVPLFSEEDKKKIKKTSVSGPANKGPQKGLNDFF